MKALRALEQANKIVLPEKRRRIKKRSLRRLAQTLPEFANVPSEVNQLLNLILILAK